MKRFFSLIALLSVTFFALGLAWGFWNEGQSARFEGKPSVRVLCAENWISDSALKAFSSKFDARVQLYTYSRPTEFLRQLANANGKIDVICTSSFLLNGLVQSQWIRKADFTKVPNAHLISVDFLNLPYDRKSEYALPIFWNLYGFFGKASVPKGKFNRWQSVWGTQRVSLWGEELNLLYVMSRNGLRLEDQLERDPRQRTNTDIEKITKGLQRILKPDLAPISAEAAMVDNDWLLLPLGRVARLLGANSPYHFWLPEDGAALEVGLLAIGAKSEQPELAKALISELINSDNALELHRRLGTGSVHLTLNNEQSVTPLQRAEALRQFPLNRLLFPNIDMETLPRFERIYDESLSKRQ